jgi:hypothetical protein
MIWFLSQIESEFKVILDSIQVNLSKKFIISIKKQKNISKCS